MEAQFTYRQADLLRNYLRAVFGLAICIAPFIWLEPAIFLVVILVAMGAVFAVLLWQTFMRQVTKVTIDQDGLSVTDWRTRRIDWANLRILHLAYYEPWNLRKSDAGRAAVSTGYLPQELGRATERGEFRTPETSVLHDQATSYLKDDRSGFMELKLQGGGQTIRIGSSLLGFQRVVKEAARAARDNRIDFKAATIANLVAIGIPDPRLDPEEPEGDAG